MSRLIEIVDRARDEGHTVESAETIADGFLNIAVTHMAEAARQVSTAEGTDPRVMTLVGFGGAAGQHLCRVADGLQMRRILDHPHAGMLSALGMGLASVGHLITRGVYRTLDAPCLKLTEKIAQQLKRETADCRRLLEDKLGRAVKLFAYPYGQRDDFDAAAEEAVAQAGFSLACSTCFGRDNEEAGRYHLNRVGIEPWDDLTTVARKLDGAYDWLRWKEKAGYGLRNFRRGL